MSAGWIWIMTGIILMLLAVVVFVITYLTINDRIRALKSPQGAEGRGDPR